MLQQPCHVASDVWPSRANPPPKPTHRELHPGLVQHRLLQAQLVHQRRQVATLPPALRSRQGGQTAAGRH